MDNLELNLNIVDVKLLFIVVTLKSDNKWAYNTVVIVIASEKYAKA